MTHKCELLRRIVRITTRIFQNYALRKPALASFMLQDNATIGEAENDQEEDRRDDVPARERASTESTRMDLDPVPNWTSD